MSRYARFARQWVVSCVVLAAASQTYALDNWYFNPLGTGFADATGVSELTVGGFGFIEQSLSWHYIGIEFEEHGAYRVMAPALPAGVEVTATYSVEGQVALLSNGFSGGTISLYSDADPDFGSTEGIFGADNGVLIAQFSVIGGMVNPIDRQAGMQAGIIPGSMPAGYFFDPFGTDLSNLSGVWLSLGVQSQVIDPSGTNVVSELACEYGGFAGSACIGEAYAAAPFDLAYATVQDVGTATLTYNGSAPIVAVPEPTSALMMLAGVLGIGTMRRFRR